MKGVKCLECGTNTVVILEEWKRRHVLSRKTYVIMGCTICGKKEVF